MERQIVAIITVDDDTAFEKIDDGPVPYFEKEFGWLEQSGITLKDCFIADEDEDEPRQAYCNYLVQFAFDNYGEQLKESPMDYYEWYQKEFREAA